MNNQKKAEVLIIGGGPAGYVCAIRLAQSGKKVILVEKDSLGGTCTNVGCIPTKSLLQSAHYYYDAKEKFKKFGIKIDNLSYDFNLIKKQMNKAVLLSRKGIEFLLNKNGVEVIFGKAELATKNLVKIYKNDNSFEEVYSDFIVLAHGSKPQIPQIFRDVEGLLTSDQIFDLQTFPESIAIIGGGVIGVEFATFFSTFNVKVYLIELLDHILPFEDEDASIEIKKSLKGNNVEIFEKTKVEEIIYNKKENNYKIIISFSNEGKIEKKEIISKNVLLSTGRVPNISEDLKNIGLKIDKGIVTDDYLRTNIENIYAIGDIRAKVMLAHVAIYEGIVAANNILGNKIKLDLNFFPSIIFSNPEISSTGLKEIDLINKDINKISKYCENIDNIKIAKFPISANGRARTMEEKDGFAKILYNKENHIILGGTIVSPYATELIMQLILACKNKLKLDELSLTIHPHPTISETILGAYEVGEGNPIHI